MANIDQYNPHKLKLTSPQLYNIFTEISPPLRVTDCLSLILLKGVFFTQRFQDVQSVKLCNILEQQLKKKNLKEDNTFGIISLVC